MTPAQQIVARKEHFEKLYDMFHTFFVEELRKDSSKFAKYRLQLTTVFLDDLALQKVAFPLFAEGNTNPAEKSAVARAALYDALVAHYFGTHAMDTGKALFARCDELEKDAAKGLSALHELLSLELGKTQKVISELERRLNKYASEKKREAGNSDAVSEGK